jgi:hypothetical protein
MNFDLSFVKNFDIFLSGTSQLERRSLRLKAFAMLTWPLEDTRIRWEAGRILLLIYCTVGTRFYEVPGFLLNLRTWVYLWVDTR